MTTYNGELREPLTTISCSADLMHRAIAEFVIDGNPLARGQRRQTELGRVRFVVKLFGFFAPGNKRLKRSLIAAL